MRVYSTRSKAQAAENQGTVHDVNVGQSNGSEDFDSRLLSQDRKVDGLAKDLAVLSKNIEQLTKAVGLLAKERQERKARIENSNLDDAQGESEVENHSAVPPRSCSQQFPAIS